VKFQEDGWHPSSCVLPYGLYGHISAVGMRFLDLREFHFWVTHCKCCFLPWHLLCSLKNGARSTVSTRTTYQGLYKIYSSILGPVFSIDIPGQHIVVLNSQKAATELLGIVIYLDFARAMALTLRLRPPLSHLQRSSQADHVGRNPHWRDVYRLFSVWTGVRHHTSVRLCSGSYAAQRWRKMRRAIHESVNVRAVEVYQPIQAESAALTVSRLLVESDNWEDQFIVYVPPKSSREMQSD
jgi:hypothetical protein